MSVERILQLEAEIAKLEEDGWDLFTSAEVYELYKEYNQVAKRLEDEGRTFPIN